MTYIYVNTDVEVDVDEVLASVDDDDLISELKTRGLGLGTQFVDGDTMLELLENVWNKRRLGKDFSDEIDKLIWYGLGKVI